MDLQKDALKKKMGKVVLEISVKPADENDKTTDLAPTVTDSDEPGVIKNDETEQKAGNVLLQEGAAAQQAEGVPAQANPFAEALIANAPDHPAGGKTLESIAKERAQKKLDAKKGLKA